MKRLALVMAACAVGAWLPSLTPVHAEGQQPIPADARVDFGVLPLTPIGPAPCLQTGGIGGPADPCAYKLHNLTPEEVAIQIGGQVTFQIHGGGSPAG